MRQCRVIKTLLDGGSETLYEGEYDDCVRELTRRLNDGENPDVLDILNVETGRLMSWIA